MKVAVITSYFNETPDQIKKAHESVMRQTIPCEHFIVVDGNIMMDPILDAQIINLSHNHANYGDTPKWIGVLSALAQGFDVVAFLDADDWLSPNHIESALVACRNTGTRIAITNRELHRPDGSVLEVNEGDDIYKSHCVVMLASAARELLHVAIKPKVLCEIGDRIMWAVIKKKEIPFCVAVEKTYHYTTKWRSHYEALNETPPHDVKEYCGNAYEEWVKLSPAVEKNYWSRYLVGEENYF